MSNGCTKTVNQGGCLCSEGELSKVERAVSCFKGGFLCSQALLSTYGPELGLDRETALKVSEVFGGGIARLGKICGAVNGAIMVIGLKHGHSKLEDGQDREQARVKTFGLVRDFVNQFKSRNGSIICKDLIKCDISTPEGIQSARENKIFATICPKFVKDAAEIIELIL